MQTMRVFTRSVMCRRLKTPVKDAYVFVNLHDQDKVQNFPDHY